MLALGIRSKIVAFATSLLVAAAAAQVAALSPAGGTEIVFKGNHFVIGSAAAMTRAIQQSSGPNVVYWPAHGALFAADPSLNGVMVYDETKAGRNIRPYGILAGPNTELNGPVALATGTDLPCISSVCTSYLWVANAGNETITYYTLPFTSWNQAPTATISWNGNPNCNAYGNPLGSPSPLQFPYGIVHNNLFGNPQGQLIQTSEANISGSFWINAWNATDSGPSQCLEAYSSPSYDTPSGPSMTAVSAAYEIFNANNTTVTATVYSGANNWSVQGTWSPGPGACTEGTAVDNSGYVYVTTNAGCKYPRTDAIWSCLDSKFNGGCPNPPVCTNSVAKLDFPDLPGFSTLTNRLYVPNQNNGTVTAYTLTGSGSATCRPKSIYVNLQTPIGVALQF
jgi:hypothetical protein